MSNRMSLNAALTELQQMFPNHSLQTIQSALRSSRGVVESAINKLLATPSSKNETPKPRPAKKVDVARSQSQDHIFPADFLTFPPETPYIKIYEDQETTSLLNLQDANEVNDAAQPPSDLNLSIPDKSVEVAGFSKPNSGWAAFKARIAEASVSYSKV